VAILRLRRPVPEPGPGDVRLKVAACGICHSDSFVTEGYWPNLAFPRVPGHEVAGLIDALGPGVSAWAPGDRVGIGWHGRHCGDCDPCRSGDFITCINLTITGECGIGQSSVNELTRLGGARVIVATAPNSAAISELVGGLGRNGMLLAIAGTFDPMTRIARAINRPPNLHSRLALGRSQGLLRRP
jgi:threonine dehydrogenase-like Zn-dependent dehydrogenase